MQDSTQGSTSTPSDLAKHGGYFLGVVARAALLSSCAQIGNAKLDPNSRQAVKDLARS